MTRTVSATIDWNTASERSWHSDPNSASGRAAKLGAAQPSGPSHSLAAIKAGRPAARPPVAPRRGFRSSRPYGHPGRVPETVRGGRARPGPPGGPRARGPY
eukprot:552022-Hanusia_phi.AAC.1